MKTTCGIFIIDKLKRIICCHPTNSSWDMWSIPKGILDEGETEKEAAIREVKEETSFIIRSNERLIELPYNQYLKDKKIKPFIYYHNEIISPRELECISYVSREGKDPFPEIDYFKLCSYEESLTRLHHSQSFYLKEYINYFK
jgi:8-oxo-dGTP pyrophosphatase MutT (NUDIX family)